MICPCRQLVFTSLLLVFSTCTNAQLEPVQSEKNDSQQIHPEQLQLKPGSTPEQLLIAALTSVKNQQLDQAV